MSALPGETYIRLAKVVREIATPGYVYEVSQEGSHFWLRVVCPEAYDNVTGKPTQWKGRYWRLSQWMTDGEIVQTALKALLTALEHEAREVFTYKGHAVFDSHYDVDRLVELRASKGAILGRPGNV